MHFLHRRESGHPWVSVIALTFSIFIVNTSEFVPIGILPDIAESFSLTSGEAGQMITIYAWLVVCLSLPLTALTMKVERRKLLLGLFLLFILFQSVGAWSPSFPALILSRTGAAFVHSLFFSLAIPLVVSMAPEGKRTKALSYAASGTALASVLGMPAGTLIGHYWGWHSVFGAIAVLALVNLLVLARSLPAMAGDDSRIASSMKKMERNRSLLMVYAILFLGVSGYYTFYSYVVDFLQNGAMISRGWVPFILMLAGIGGVCSSLLFPALYRCSPRYCLYADIIVLTGVLFLMDIPFSETAALRIAGVCGLVMVFTVFQLILQSRIFILASGYADLANSLFSSVFNVGIGMGALAGGRLLNGGTDVDRLGFAGAFFAAAALASEWAVLRFADRGNLQADLQKKGEKDD
jgi:DHA1 family L-arabinose/isopropyl-beta-D-thiogalactopyranoside export protein-like MFS transporter